MPVQLTIGEIFGGRLDSRARRMAVDQMRLERETNAMIAERFVQELLSLHRSPMVLDDLLECSRKGDQRAVWLVERVIDGNRTVLACLRHHDIDFK